MASSPADLEVAFSCSHSQSPVRLLELPPALLSLLSVDPAPTIKIKAAPADTPSSTTHHAVLCTPNQTFSLRHVHSSNSTFLLAPSDPTCPGVNAVSTATSYLELVATSPSGTTLLQKYLRPYHGWDEEAEGAGDGDGDVAMLNPHSPAANNPTTIPDVPLLSKSSIIDDLPMSDAEFEYAWRETMAFEHRHALYRPMPAAILKVFEAVLLAAAVEKIPLNAPFDMARLTAAVAADQPAIPVGLIHTVMCQICDEADGNKLVLNLPRCTAFVGRCILEDHWQQKQKKPNTHDLLYISFMGRWKTKVPDTCANLCKLDLLKGWYTLPTQNTISFVPPVTEAPKPAAPSSTSDPTAAKNKWHEKLGKGKKR